MKLWSNSFMDAAVIPAQNAFCTIDPATHVRLSDNKNPHLAWENIPTGTRSLVLICCDPDAPSVGDDVNQEGKMIAADLPRANFYHWTLINLPASLKSIEEGVYSNGVTAGGKPGPLAPEGAWQGINDYTAWFAGDKDMAGDYYGYDGPCPPWNDSIPHRYTFSLYALNTDKLEMQPRFTAQEVLKAMEGKILGQAHLTGIYTLNPLLAGSIGK